MRSVPVVVTVLALAAAEGCGGGTPYGRVAGGDVRLEGQVNADYFPRQLDQLYPWFEACYARTLRRDRAAEGVIEIRMRGRAGTIRPEVVRNETGSDELARCVADAVTNLPLVERPGDEPWDFTATWPVEFTIARRE